MVRCLAHYDSTVNLKLFLSSNSIDFADKKYRTLDFGSDLVVFIRDDQLEQLFALIDIKLHEVTYTQLEDAVFGTNVELEEAQETIQYYRDLEEEGRYK